MNKKFSVLIALLLVVALAVPTSAAVFTDVSEDHWAYEAVNKLVAAGIISGYPDGTFQGDNNMTRYEIAIALNRTLDRIAEEREYLADEVDAMKDGFTSAQQTELKDIVKSIVEENMPEPEEKDDDEEEGLNETEYEQIANLIEALTFNYKAELQNLGADLEDVEDLVDANKEDVDATIAELRADMEEKMNKITFSGDYSASYTEIGATGDGTAYYDPFDHGDGNGPGYDEYDVGVNSFLHELNLNTAVKHGPLSANFSMVAADDIFDGNYDSTNYSLTDLSAQISGNDFEAWIEEDQALTIKPYLFDGAEDVADGTPSNPANGVIVDAYGNTYVMSDQKDTVFAATESMDFMGRTLDFAFGAQNLISGGRNLIVGVGTEMEFAGFDVKPEFAVSDKSLSERYFTVNVNGDLGPVATTYNLSLINDFDEIKASVADTKGHDVLGEMSVSNIDLSAYYESYNDFNDPNIELIAEVTEENAYEFGNFDVFADFGYNSYLDVNDATSTRWNVTAKDEMGKFDLTGELNYDVTTKEYETAYGDTDVFAETDMFNKIATVDYVMNDYISALAKMALDKDNDLSQKYAVDYEKGILSAGVEKYFSGAYFYKGDEFYLTTSVDPEAYDIMEVSFDPYANLGMEFASPSNSLNIAFGFDAEKELNKYSILTAGFEWADKEYAVDSAGRKIKIDLGTEYEVSENVNATANAEYLDFDADAGKSDDYTAKKATAGISVSF